MDRNAVKDGEIIDTLISRMKDLGYNFQTHDKGIVLQDTLLGEQKSEVQLGAGTIEFLANAHSRDILRSVFFHSSIADNFYLDPNNLRITYRSTMFLPYASLHTAQPMEYQMWKSMPVDQFLREIRSPKVKSDIPKRPLSGIMRRFSALLKKQS